jgi:large subunit ribosomal protein L9
MEVILRQEVPALGREGEIVKVANGYANNYLFPKGLAVIATKGNLKQLEQKRGSLAKKEEAARAEARELAGKLESQTVTIEAKAGAEDRLYGSVTAKDIAAAVEEKLGLKIDRRRLQLAEPIKQAGEVAIPVKLHPDVEASLKVEVVAQSAE